MTARTTVAGVAVLIAGLAGTACQTSGLSLDELPEVPIAFRHWEPLEARERADALTELKNKKDKKRGAPSKDEGLILDVSEVEKIVDSLRPDHEDASINGRYPGRIAFVDPRTGRVTPVPVARPGAFPAAWSSDHRRLLFSQPQEQRLQLFEYDVVDGVVRPMTRGPDIHPDGCFAGDGRYLFMIGTVEQGRPVTYMELTEPGGSRPHRISDGPFESGPACAPDGSAVAWVTRRDDREWITVRSPVVDGANRQLAPGSDPAFSPDGAWIVYAAPVKRGTKLYRIRPDGSGRAPLGRGNLDEHDPAYSPDGRVVVYVANQGERSGLYLRRVDGTGDRIFPLDGDGTYPTW